MREEYPVYVKWRYITAYMLDICANYPKSLRFNLADRLTNTTLDVLERIIEAIYTRQRRSILVEANLGLEKIRALLHISVERRCISIRQYEHISGEIQEAGKMIGGWLKTCGE